jgi:peptidoglycan/xylan/chitin deacetylase (PgdA/CDA1 family)
MRKKHKKSRLGHVFLYFIFIASIVILGIFLFCAECSFFKAVSEFVEEIDPLKILQIQNEDIEKDLRSEPAKFGDPNFAILMYHHINYKNSKFAVTPENFERQIKFFIDSGYDFIKLSSAFDFYANEEGDLNKKIVLTFDDGYRDFYENAFPILKKYKIPATLFVINQDIGKKGNVTIEMIKEMQNTGLVEVGAHTLNHFNLRRCRQATVQDQIAQGKAELEKELGVEIKLFAYPFGAFTEYAKDLIRTNGFVGAVSVYYGEKPNRNDLYAWRRFMMTNSDQGGALLRKLYVAFELNK